MKNHIYWIVLFLIISQKGGFSQTRLYELTIPDQEIIQVGKKEVRRVIKSLRDSLEIKHRFIKLRDFDLELTRKSRQRLKNDSTLLSLDIEVLKDELKGLGIYQYVYRYNVGSSYIFDFRFDITGSITDVKCYFEYVFH